MAATTHPHPIEIRRNWRRAAQCSPALIAPSKYVSELMELTLAVGGPAMQQHYDAFVADPNGQELLELRPSLRDHLADHDSLAALPDGSFGRAYLAFVNTYRFDAATFDEIHDVHQMGERLGWDDDLTFVIERGLQLHDIWHTLGGYGPDWAGEAGVIHFTYGVVPFPGSQLIARIFRVLNGSVPLGRWHRYLSQARARGAASEGLMTAHYEDLLPLPLDDVRRRLGVTRPDVAHPGGMPYSRFQYGVGQVLDEAYESKTAA